MLLAQIPLEYICKVNLKEICVYCISVCNYMNCFAMKYCLHPLDD